MNKKTLNALKASIAHHKENLKAETLKAVKLGPDYCALCELFYSKNCVGCPVFARTKRPGCWGTPYVRMAGTRSAWACAELNSGPEDCQSAREAFREVEREEITFLESLLPEGR